MSLRLALVLALVSYCASYPELLHGGGYYLRTPDNKAVFLSGSHTWSNLQDRGTPFDWEGYLDLLANQEKANFIRMWKWDSSQWDTQPQYDPLPYVRTGPGLDNVGLPKFDLNQFNQNFFDRMRARVIEAGNRGFWVSIMLFQGWDANIDGPNNWVYNAWNAANNINGINGDPYNQGNGGLVQTLNQDVAAVTASQKAYIRKVIDTVNDLTNVLYEISNEITFSYDTNAWVVEMIRYVHEYEQTKPLQHPVGYTGPINGDWAGGKTGQVFI